MVQFVRGFEAILSILAPVINKPMSGISSTICDVIGERGAHARTGTMMHRHRFATGHTLLLVLLCSTGRSFAGKLVINGRTVATFGSGGVTLGGPRQPKHLSDIPLGVDERFACHSLDFSDSCGVFWGTESQPSQMGAVQGIPLGNGALLELDRVQADSRFQEPMSHSDSASYPNPDEEAMHQTQTPSVDPAGGGAGLPGEEPTDAPARPPKTGVSFALEDLFGGPGVGLTDKARDLKKLIMSGARVHAGSVQVVRSHEGSQQVVKVNLTPEILLKLIQLSEKEYTMQQALAIVIDTSNTMQYQQQQQDPGEAQP